jgi:hypothetical protein
MEKLITFGRLLTGLTVNYLTGKNKPRKTLNPEKNYRLLFYTACTIIVANLIVTSSFADPGGVRQGRKDTLIVSGSPASLTPQSSPIPIKPTLNPSPNPTQATPLVSPSLHKSPSPSPSTQSPTATPSSGDTVNGSSGSTTVIKGNGNQTTIINNNVPSSADDKLTAEERAKKLGSEAPHLIGAAASGVMDEASKQIKAAKSSTSFVTATFATATDNAFTDFWEIIGSVFWGVTKLIVGLYLIMVLINVFFGYSHRD